MMIMDNNDLYINSEELSELEELGCPEELVIHSNEELLQKLLEAEEDIRLGRVMDYKDFDKMIREEYGF